MRLLDFLEDLRDTSIRISERDAYTFNDPDLIGHLTIRTLMRPDVTEYFDTLLEKTSHLQPCQTIIAYLYLYAYVINVRPRPMQAQMLQAGKMIAKSLQAFDPLNNEFHHPPTGQLPLPTTMKRKISQLLKLNDGFGLKFHYTQNAPEYKVIRKMVGDSEASLWLYTTPADEPTPKCDRLTYAGPVFVAPKLHLYALYISAA